MCGLPASATEADVKKWLALALSNELLGQIYYIAMDEVSHSCYVTFITYKLMRDAKQSLARTRYFGKEVTLETPDVTRNDLVCTKLNVPKDNLPPLSFFLSKTDVVVNLICMTSVWLITVFNFYLINFLVNTFDQIFLSCIAAAVSEFFAQAFGGYIFDRIGVKQSLCVSFSMAAIGSFAMLTYGLNHQKEWIFPTLVLFMKFGIASCFNITYVCHKTCFPTLFATTSLGYCTFICRFFTAFTPILSAMDQYFSVLIFTVTSACGAVIVLQLRTISEDDFRYGGEAEDLATIPVTSTSKVKKE